MDEEKIGERFQTETKYRQATSLSGRLPVGEATLGAKPQAALEVISLPSALPFGEESLKEIMGRRRSRREFLREPLSFQGLSQLLWATQGVTAREGNYAFRTSPSAGALYPIDTYPIVNHVEGLKTGIYRLKPLEWELELLKGGDFSWEIGRACLQQEMAARASVVMAWVAVVERSKWKYRERAYRYIYLDAGHIGQNLYLAATALGLGCCTIGAFSDEDVDNLLGVDGLRETTVYLGAVGKLAHSS